jgi:catechol 2,3-dioxygenase-like lactoylglutathione lyase family enzyme
MIFSQFLVLFCWNASRGVAAFVYHPQQTLARRCHDNIMPFFAASHVNGEQQEDCMSQNKLLHCMLRVPNVNATLDFWKEQGANVYSYRKTSKAETAFVGFGEAQQDSFSLEITKINDDFVLGNAISYFGISMLRDMKNLVMAAAGEKSGWSVANDPNGIELRPVASAPGDVFARICFNVNSSQKDVFAQTTSFYEQLGMELVAADEQVICLRYTNKKKNDSGVATTLVFSKSLKELEMGNCYDHLAISTPNVQAAATALRDSLDDPDDVIFMDPCPMFGTQIMGLIDPNGYKVFLVEQQ